MNDPLRHFDQSDLIVGAFRYYLGRMTSVTPVFARALAASWKDLGKEDRLVIARDLEAAFKEDDYSREASNGYRALGHDCDREAWEEVRACYETRYEKPKCRWMYQDSHDQWYTDCSKVYDAADFGCKEIKVCPGCGKETRT